MSEAVFNLTKHQIEIGYQEKNGALIEKETEFIVNKIIACMLTMVSDKVVGISFDKHGVSISNEYLLSDRHHKNLLKWLNRLMSAEILASDVEFGRFKVDFENWYYQMGGEMVEFHYQENYLLTPQETAELMGISKVTLNKYIQRGLECIATTSHRKIPKHVIELWKDVVYAIRMQKIYQDKNLRSKLPIDRLKEINNELTELYIKYDSQEFSEAFKEYDGDSMEDPNDYYLWRDLEEEKKDILRLLKSKGDKS